MDEGAVDGKCSGFFVDDGVGRRQFWARCARLGLRGCAGRTDAVGLVVGWYWRRHVGEEFAGCECYFICASAMGLSAGQTMSNMLCPAKFGDLAIAERLGDVRRRGCQVRLCSDPSSTTFDITSRYLKFKDYIRRSRGILDNTLEHRSSYLGFLLAANRHVEHLQLSLCLKDTVDAEQSRDNTTFHLTLRCSSLFPADLNSFYFAISKVQAVRHGQTPNLAPSSTLTLCLQSGMHAHDIFLSG